MVLYVGIDDTDSLGGMCTTFLGSEVTREVLSKTDLDLIGYPRLVRLNPNIPWKTRGNGALCLRFGRGVGREMSVGNIEGKRIVAYPRWHDAEDPREIEDIVASVVERWSRFEDEMTNPGFVILARQPTPALYWKAVRDIVTKDEAVNAISRWGLIRVYKNGRGVIGAASATAWRPRDRTYEVLTYRRKSLWGTKRDVDPSSVIEMDKAFPSTFNNYDYENRKVIIAPSSPCPVLFGIRGDAPTDLRSAMEMIRWERPVRWLIFESNQGTDDHVVNQSVFRPWTTVRVRGRVTSPPRNLLGGHVVFQVNGMDATAYEPSKQFRRIVWSLMTGDCVRVIGAVRDSPRTLNLEKLGIVSLARVWKKVSNPVCPKCHVRMKSLGRGAGYRCRRCRRTAPVSAARLREIRRLIRPGWYEPPVCSRRHLSKPLKRGVPCNI